MPDTRDLDPVSTMNFMVTIDNVHIGAFTALDGLSAQYEVRTYAAGGENGFVHKLPGRLTYGTVKLTRPVGWRDDELVGWFDDVAQGKVKSPGTAAVTALDAERRPVVTWQFRGVWPVSYKGPSFAAEGGKTALEVFEFAHEGWTEKSHRPPEPTPPASRRMFGR
ncbi:phage tail protein [Cellulomonas sp. S1-8]|uniref:phage tail protein n=1 Tax=Cellulomonas sp. S1-8 TaxID=2904790 RepID=UPI002243514B|nr:phage tail protein [Cellulomonas sp. S1-8]UZN02562.1 phage tail protein [Cellulomonas sp. S1-8]